LFVFVCDADNAVLKQNGVFPNQDAVKEAARSDAKKMKSATKSERSDVGRIM
jgi:hypothetical protein